MTAVKINVDKVSLKVFFETMAKMNDNVNETSFVHSITKRRLQIKAQARAADFLYAWSIFWYNCFEEGLPMDAWPAWSWAGQHQAGVGNFGFINCNLMSGDHYDYAGNAYQIPQNMADIKIEVDSNEFQE